jgi:hypothetical protein
MKVTAEVVPLGAFPPEDARQFIEWAWLVRKANRLDKDVLAYPRACMCVAKLDGNPALYVPIHPVLMWESLVPDPNLTPQERALALWRVAREVDGVMKLTGMMETYFFTSDDHFAEVARRHGFEEVKNVRILRRKANSPSLGRRL